jgi:hypothetical protein
VKIIPCQQGTDEWRAARAGIATASEFGCILAKARSGNDEATTRRNYRVRLVVERLAGKPLEGGFATFATRQGTEREPLAREAYEVRTGNLVQEVGVCLHDELACGASPDGLVNDDGGVEIKCPELAAHLDYLRRKDEPPEYRAQIQGNLWITGRAWWDFVSFNPDFPPHLQLLVRRVPRDDKYIAGLEFNVRMFLGEVAEEEAAVRALQVAA